MERDEEATLKLRIPIFNPLFHLCSLTSICGWNFSNSSRISVLVSSPPKIRPPKITLPPQHLATALERLQGGAAPVSIRAPREGGDRDRASSAA